MLPFVDIHQFSLALILTDELVNPKPWMDSDLVQD